MSSVSAMGRCDLVMNGDFDETATDPFAKSRVHTCITTGKEDMIATEPQL